MKPIARNGTLRSRSNTKSRYALRQNSDASPLERSEHYVPCAGAA